MNQDQVVELLYQALETERGGVSVYRAALRCAQNPDLKEEWEKYLEETRRHEELLREAFSELELDPDRETVGRGIVRAKSEALVRAMESALEMGQASLAELIATESVVEAETKDHSNWELIGRVADDSPDPQRSALERIYEEVEKQEDRHLYHTMGWARELWLESLGLPAVLPPPEEERDVVTAIGAARAEQQRQESRS